MPIPLRAMIVSSGLKSSLAIESWLRALPSVVVVASTTDIAHAVVVTASQPIDLLVIDDGISDAARRILTHHAHASEPTHCVVPVGAAATFQLPGAMWGLPMA